MRLTTYSDYALRTLMLLAENRDRLMTIQEIADLHGIAKNHLTKVVHHLGQLGIIETLRGRNGGLRLAMEPKDVDIGKLLRSTEPDFFMAECFDRTKNRCIYSPTCFLKSKLQEATTAYLDVLSDVTLADLVNQRAKPQPDPGAPPGARAARLPASR